MQYDSGKKKIVFRAQESNSPSATGTPTLWVLSTAMGAQAGSSLCGCRKYLTAVLQQQPLGKAGSPTNSAKMHPGCSTPTTSLVVPMLTCCLTAGSGSSWRKTAPDSSPPLLVVIFLALGLAVCVQAYAHTPSPQISTGCGYEASVGFLPWQGHTSISLYLHRTWRTN